MAGLPVRLEHVKLRRLVERDGRRRLSVAGYNIYVSVDGGPFSLWLNNTTATDATYSGQPGHSYAFFSLATDSSGNLQAVAGQC